MVAADGRSTWSLGAPVSKTFKTLPPETYALSFHKRDRTGLRVLPRIVYRNPRPGDIHPLSPAMVRDLLWFVPAEYIYGLKAIELRPRQGEIGEPYGAYLFRDKRIWLYSCPPHTWRFTAKAWPNHMGVLSSGARLAAHQEDPASVFVEWDDPDGIWRTHIHTLFHELGHHYVNQYRSSRGRPGIRTRNEGLADLHDTKIWDKLRRMIAKRRAGT
jgi:hypothetical protein